MICPLFFHKSKFITSDLNVENIKIKYPSDISLRKWKSVFQHDKKPINIGD